MATSRRDDARGQAGKVGKANCSQQHSKATDLFPESLPTPVASLQPVCSTATEAQRQRIVEMLRTGPKTTLDFRRAGSMQSQTRIFELRAQGYDIATVSRVTAYDDQGHPHCGVAVYELLAEPDASSQVREAQS